MKLLKLPALGALQAADKAASELDARVHLDRAFPKPGRC